MARILTLLAPGFEEIEAVTVIDLLRRAGIEVITASITADRMVCGSHDICILADITVDDAATDKFDGIFLPGGQPGSNNLKQNTRVLDMIRSFYFQQKWVMAICAAPLVLLEAGILSGRRITSYPAEKGSFQSEKYEENSVVQDGQIITSRGVGTAIDFALALIEIFKGKKVREEQAGRILWK